MLGFSARHSIPSALPCHVTSMLMTLPGSISRPQCRTSPSSCVCEWGVEEEDGNERAPRAESQHAVSFDAMRWLPCSKIVSTLSVDWLDLLQGAQSVCFDFWASPVKKSILEKMLDSMVMLLLHSLLQLFGCKVDAE